MEREAYWSFEIDDLLKRLNSSRKGLTSQEAQARINFKKSPYWKFPKLSRFSNVLIAQFTNPFIVLLISCASFLFFYGDPIDAVIIGGIIFLSSFLGFWQEWKATGIVESLLSLVELKSKVLRDGLVKEVSSQEVVEGDVVFLSSGNLVPGDGVVLEFKDFFIDEAILTGEAYAVEKSAERVALNASLSQRKNCVFMGSQVISGHAKVLVVRRGEESILGKTAQKLSQKKFKNEFENGLSKLSYFLIKIAAVFVFISFVFNLFLQRPFFDSLVFALTLAVGLAPQLLPTIVSINLACGAKRMARESVIIKRAPAIVNLGSIDVLCSDKTGTLTESKMQLKACINILGEESEKLARFAFLNASLQGDKNNPIDSSILNKLKITEGLFEKKGVIPYDYQRKRISVLILQNEEKILITKGAANQIIEICSCVEIEGGRLVDFKERKELIQKKIEAYSEEGYRVIALAYKTLDPLEALHPSSEKEMVFLGFLIFENPLKAFVCEAVQELNELGVKLKIITGDNRFISHHIAKKLISDQAKMMTGEELGKISDQVLIHKVQSIDVFSEVEPHQKERIVQALKKRGYVVGFLGDGINDLMAMHASDVGISATQAADSAREVADVILLNRDLRVLLEGLKLGRKTLVNTFKYLTIDISANFGNAFSLLVACFFLPLLPFLPKQMLLVNLLTDVVEATVAIDRVDKEEVKTPLRWNVGYIKKFMISLGVVSSFFDVVTFTLLFTLLDLPIEVFRTGWFLESILSAVIGVFVLRTKRFFYKSMPHKGMIIAAVFISLVSLVFMTMPWREYFGFSSLPWVFFPLLLGILLSYLFVSEGVKRWLVKKARLATMANQE